MVSVFPVSTIMLRAPQRPPTRSRAAFHQTSPQEKRVAGGRSEKGQRKRRGGQTTSDNADERHQESLSKRAEALKLRSW